MCLPSPALAAQLCFQVLSKHQPMFEYHVYFVCVVSCVQPLCRADHAGNRDRHTLRRQGVQCQAIAGHRPTLGQALQHGATPPAEMGRHRDVLRSQRRPFPLGQAQSRGKLPIDDLLACFLYAPRYARLSENVSAPSPTAVVCPLFR